MNTITRKDMRAFVRWVAHPSQLFWSPTREMYEDIFRRASRTQSLGDLLQVIPEHVCTALKLASFHLFVQEVTEGGQQVFRLESSSASKMEFAASSATVLRLRRDRKPAAYYGSENASMVEAWQLLASADEISALDELKTQLLVPLTGRMGLIGFVAMARPEHQAFSRSELIFLRKLGQQMGLGLETALLLRKLTDQAVERERSTQELALARDVQEHLLPRSLPVVKDLDFAAFYQSMGAVGGDYYDVIETPKGKFCFVVADVSGKGISAALLMSSLRASLHTLLRTADFSASRICEELNEIIFQSSAQTRYVTLFLAIHDPPSETLHCCNAGHVPPLLRRANGQIVSLSTGGTAIGLFGDSTYDEERFNFCSGDTLVACTDGITEATNAVGDEWLDEGLSAALRKNKGGDATSIMSEIRESLRTFVGSTPQADDLTLLVMTRRLNSESDDNLSIYRI